MEKLQIPAWILAVGLFLFALGFMLSLFLLDEPRMFAGMEFGPKKQDVAIPAKDSWPEGTYGLLADGKCPSGFDQQSAHLNAVNIHSTEARYIKQAKLGSSWIGLHNNGNSGNLGDVMIVACFKQ